MIQLDGMILCPYLHLEKNNFPRVAGSERPTLGKRIIVQRYGFNGGEMWLEATLSGDKLYGFYTTEQIEKIRGIADSGRKVSLSYHGTEYKVIIPLDGLEVTPWGYRTQPASDHPHYGKIRMLET